MNVDPEAAAVAEFLASAPDEPFVMLNLVRFVEGGRESYTDYLRQAAPYVEAAGARVIFLGKGMPPLVGGSDQEWDTVLLVWYPSPAAFSAMVEDPGYEEVARLRTAALEAAVLQPTRAVVS